MSTSLTAVLRRFGALALVPAAWTAAAAQSQAPSYRWEVSGPRAGWCLHFLMDPEEAQKELVGEERPVTAGLVKGLPPAIERVLADDPKYAEWIPSVVCTYVVDSISVDGRTYDRGDGKQPLAFLYWGVAATGDALGSEPGARSFRVFGTNSSGLQRVMESHRLRIDRVDVKVQPIKDSEDEQYRLKLEGATIFLDGHPRPDSAGTVVPEQRTGELGGYNKSVWKVQLAFQPAEVGTLAGALRVEGKRGLAKVLQQSPIRYVGPVLAGGSASVTFSR
ncbi:MAG TPA: hypothetical protein VNH46_06270 [Gemmatimonadales bacterium]|nr:hypothetical protein [Gemmatimonadales bacterium]